jgi:hypothetical protein
MDVKLFPTDQVYSFIMGERIVNNDMAKFESFLAESFQEGNMSRELRLSDQEIEHLKKKYPRAMLNKVTVQDHSDDRVWYEVSFSV